MQKHPYSNNDGKNSISFTQSNQSSYKNNLNNYSISATHSKHETPVRSYQYIREEAEADFMRLS